MFIDDKCKCFFTDKGVILIKPKHISILASFVAVLTFAFCFWMVQIHKTAVKAEEALAIAAAKEAVAQAQAAEKTNYNPISAAVDPDPSASTNSTASTSPAPVNMTDLVLLKDYLDVKQDDFYKTTPFLLTEDGKMVEKLMPYQDVRIKYGTLQKLKKADALLKEQGYNLVIFCAYRDEETQVLLRQHYENLTGDVGAGYNYVAHPGKSRHQSGQAVDLTIESFVGERQDPTPYLEFTDNVKPQNHTDNAFLQILQKAMVDSGFSIYNGEWWHFNDEEIYE